MAVDLKALMAKHNGDANKALAEMSQILDSQAAELRAAKLGMAGKITLKVGEKGGVSAYGLGRFPVTLYREQWERLFGEVERIKAFIAANADSLKSKGDATAEKTGTDSK